jgi:GT2 family glycosyltransferase
MPKGSVAANLGAGKEVPGREVKSTAPRKAARSAVRHRSRLRRQLALRRRVSTPDVSGLFPRVDWVLGAAFLVRAEAFHAVEGFDESYFLYSEETDLAYRLRSQGWSSHLVQRAAVSHLGRRSTSGRAYERGPALSRWKFIRRHWSRRKRLALACSLAGVYVWNSIYVISRILLSPRSLKEKSRLWREHWLARPVR